MVLVCIARCQQAIHGLRGSWVAVDNDKVALAVLLHLYHVLTLLCLFCTIGNTEICPARHSHACSTLLLHVLVEVVNLTGDLVCAVVFVELWPTLFPYRIVLRTDVLKPNLAQ